jgi:hypothetical protein
MAMVRYFPVLSFSSTLQREEPEKYSLLKIRNETFLEFQSISVNHKMQILRGKLERKYGMACVWPIKMPKF